MNPSSVSVSWALVLREILREEWKSCIEDDDGRRQHGSVDIKQEGIVTILFYGSFTRE